MKRLTLPLLVLFWVAGMSHIYAQPFSYSGTYNFGPFEGTAQFDYNIVRGDTVLNGSFSFDQINIHKLLTNTDNYCSINGQFKENIPNDLWEFTYGKFNKGDQVLLLNNNYQIQVNGVQSSARGTLFEGKPNGLWEFITHRIENSRIDNILFKSAFHFKNGTPQKNFKISNEKLSLVGRFLRDGFAHDHWELYGDDSANAIEQMVFDDGILQTIILSNDDLNYDTLDFFNDSTSSYQSILLNSRYLDFLSLHQLINKNDIGITQSKIYDLLIENTNNYKKISDIVVPLGGNSFDPQLKVKVPYYPLNEEESIIMNQLRDNYSKSRKIIERIDKSSPIQLLKLTNELFAINVAGIERVNDLHLKYIQQFLEIQDLKIIEFVSRKALLKQLFQTNKPQTLIDINYEYGGDHKTTQMYGPNHQVYSFNDVSLKSLENISTYVYLTLDSLQNELQSRLTDEQRQQELDALGKDLLDQVETLKTLNDSLSRGAEPFVKEMLASIETNAEKKLKAYSLEQEINKRNSLQEELSLGFSLMINLAKAVAQLPEKRESIKKTYTERVWNPFTATLMNEEQKRPIVFSYINVLEPHFSNEVAKDFESDEISSLLNLLDKVYQQMLDLKEIDTRALERKLKKEKDPNRVLQLFSLYLTANES